MIKNFTVTKKDNKGDDKLPNRSISTKIGDEYKYIGVGWVKQDKNNNPYVSVKLEDTRTYKNKNDETVKVEGYCIISDTDYEKVKHLLGGEVAEDASYAKAVETLDEIF